MAPSVVGESLKGAELLAEVMQTHLGYPCYPPPGSHRTDIIQAVRLGSRKKVERSMCYNLSVLLFASCHHRYILVLLLL